MSLRIDRGWDGKRLIRFVRVVIIGDSGVRLFVIILTVAVGRKSWAILILIIEIFLFMTLMAQHLLLQGLIVILRSIFALIEQQFPLQVMKLNRFKYFDPAKSIFLIIRQHVFMALFMGLIFSFRVI